LVDKGQKGKNNQEENDSKKLQKNSIVDRKSLLTNSMSSCYENLSPDKINSSGNKLSSPNKLIKISSISLSNETQRRLNILHSIRDKILNIWNCFKLIKKTKLMSIIDGKQFISKIFNNSEYKARFKFL